MILFETSVISESLKLTVGERKENLHLGLEQRILPFDASASQAYADILSKPIAGF
jgi:predicted nucleic acid-binding protein